MIAVWYDPESDQIWIGDRPEPFPPGTLVLREADGLMHVHRKTQTVSLAGGDFTAFCDGVGIGFPSHDAAAAYLRGVFARRPVSTAIEPAIAAVAIGGHRVVRVAGPGRVALASSDDVAKAGTVIGLTLGAAEAGAWVDVLTRGPVTEPAFTFEPGPVFLGPDGLLTQTAPMHGFVQQVGTALGPDRLLVALDAPYILAS